MNNHYGNRINRIAFRIRCSVVGALFKKSTALSTGGKAVYSAGEIVNMMSNDADRCRNLIVQINQLWMLPFNFAFALYLLVDLVVSAASDPRSPPLAWPLLTASLPGRVLRRSLGWR